MNKFAEAIFKNDINELNILLNGYQYINIPKIDGTTLLYKAVLYNKIKIVELLLAKGAVVNAMNSDSFDDFKSIGNNYINEWSDHHNKSPIDLANSNNKEIIKVLIQNGASPDFEYKKLGVGGLYKAILDNDIEYAVFLLKNGASLQKRNNIYIPRDNNADGNNFKQLHEHKSVVELIFKENNLELIEKLINDDAILNYFLCYAIKNEKNEISKFLIESCRDLNKKSILGYPLMYAVSGENIYLVELLLQKGANPNISNYLAVACENQNLKMLKLLVEYKADTNHTDDNGRTPLFSAIEATKANKEIIRFLMANGADIHKEDNSGISPLSFAESNKVSLVKVLTGHVEVKLSENQDPNIVANYQNLLDKIVLQNKVINKLKDEVKTIKNSGTNNQAVENYKAQIDDFKETISSQSNEIKELQNNFIQKEQEINDLMSEFTSKINKLEEKIAKQNIVKTKIPINIPTEKQSIKKDDGVIVKRDSFDDF